MERITLAPGAHINVLPAEKFNRCRISINFIWPAAREWATAEALLPLVLERGYQGCPDMTELSRKLARSSTSGSTAASVALRRNAG